jgi:hypothetical protein
MKSVITGLTMFLLTFSAFAGTFVETFNRRNLDGWEQLIQIDFEADPDSWEIIDGELQGTNLGGLFRFLTMGDEKWRNYTIEFDVKPLHKHGAGSIGIAARIQGAGGIVSMIGDAPFPLHEDGSHVVCFGGDFHDNKFWVFGSEVNSSLKLRRWSTMKLQVDEDVFTFWINGKQVLKVRDEWVNNEKALKARGEAFQFRTGGVGVVISSYTARFDNMVITGKDISNQGQFSVTPQAKLATTWGSLKGF